VELHRCQSVCHSCLQETDAISVTLTETDRGSIAEAQGRTCDRHFFADDLRHHLIVKLEIDDVWKRAGTS
jgi:hypothetical protein